MEQELLKSTAASLGLALIDLPCRRYALIHAINKHHYMPNVVDTHLVGVPTSTALA